MNKSKAVVCAAVMACTVAIAGISAAAATDSQDVIVYDKDNVWTQTTQIDLFERNELGNQLVYPGVNGEYSFTVRNRTDEDKECQVVVTDENKFSIPLDIRVKMNGEYIVGSDSAWADSASFDTGIFILNGKDEMSYELEWKWDFEINDKLNDRDTALGKNARFEDEPYNLKIEVFAETAPPESSEPSSPSDPDSSIPTAPDDKPTTGDSSSAVIPVFFILTSAAAILIATAKKKKKSN